MSTRTQFRPQVILDAVSMATDQTSDVTILQSLSRVAYAFSWSGTTPIGTLSLQGSNNYALNPDGTVGNSGTWVTLAVEYNGSVVTEIPVSGNTGTGSIDVTTAFYAIRVFYDRTSGVGTLTGVINGKVS